MPPPLRCKDADAPRAQVRKGSQLQCVETAVEGRPKIRNIAIPIIEMEEPEPGAVAHNGAKDIVELLAVLYDPQV
jgi:hypothetical protein